MLFEFDSATLTQEGRETLAKIAGVLLVARDAGRSIEGHTDDVGSAEYNLELSRTRAESVRDYFVAQDIPEDDVSVKGLGESQPIATNDTAEGRQKNRRVEIVVEEGTEFGFATSTE